MQDDIKQFEEMVADCYAVFIGTKHTIEITKKAFEYAGVNIGSVIFYEVKSKRNTENRLLPITDKKLKIEILKELHII